MRHRREQSRENQKKKKRIKAAAHPLAANNSWWELVDLNLCVSSLQRQNDPFSNERKKKFNLIDNFGASIVSAAIQMEEKK